METNEITFCIERTRWLAALRRVAISYLHEGNTKEALRYFKEIEAHEALPDNPHHADLIFAYRHALGLVP